MKKIYQLPELSILNIKVADLITTSGGYTQADEGDGDIVYWE
ncbi:MAG: hypothetical protein ACI3XQ_01575 [Eubacteriales bacterium]